MNAFVIKNKEGKYFSMHWTMPLGNIWTNDIFIANKYADNKTAINMIEYVYKISSVKPLLVPISICEGDLEEENRVLKKALEFVCDGYARPNVYGTDIWEEAEKCGGLEQYFIQQAKESEKDECVDN